MSFRYLCFHNPCRLVLMCLYHQAVHSLCFIISDNDEGWVEKFLSQFNREIDPEEDSKDCRESRSNGINKMWRIIMLSIIL